MTKLIYLTYASSEFISKYTKFIGSPIPLLTAWRVQGKGKLSH